MGLVSIHVRLRMLFDILCRLPTVRITSHTDSIWILIDANIIKPQVRRRIFLNVIVNGRKVPRHAQIHDDRQRLKRDNALPYVAVRTDSSPVKRPCLVGANKPAHVPLNPWSVFEGVDLVCFAVVPIVVKVCDAGHGLLVGPAAIGVYLGYGGVVDGGEV